MVHMPQGAGQEDSARTTSRSWVVRLARGVLGFLGAIVLILGIAELAVRLAGPIEPPRQIRDGLFVSRLPLTSGQVGALPWVPEDAETLSADKAEGELRVFVFGESSVEGALFGYEGSFVTMLHELLVQQLPGRDVTTVNMGRGAAFATDVLYYLMGISPFEPDVIVLYLGANEYYDGGERCAPYSAPGWYGAWRWLVGHSRLLWVARVFGPKLLAGDGEGAGGLPSEVRACPFDETFAAWADILVSQARSLGAEVVVVTPVRAASAAAEIAFSVSHRYLAPGKTIASAPAPYSRLLRCALDPACDPTGPLVEHLESETATRALWSLVGGMAGGSSEAPGDSSGDKVAGGLSAGINSDFLRASRAAWRAAAERYGAAVVDFSAAVEAESPRGLLGSPLILDEVHLTLSGNARWAVSVASAILGVLGDGGGRSDARNAVAAAELAERHGRGAAAPLVSFAIRELRARKPLYAANAIEDALLLPGDCPEAEQLRAWMLAKIGPPLASAGERLGSLSLEDMVRELGLDVR